MTTDLSFTPYYIYPDRELWQGRVDPAPTQLPIPEEHTHRIHQRVQFLDLTKELPPAPSHSLAILGFRSDIGVSRNQGRPGAADAPPAIRKAMANHAWHLPDATILFDAGDIQPIQQTQTLTDPLATSQNVLASHISRLHQAGYTPILLGGGHEIAKPQYMGTTAAYPNLRIGIINIDAHFDLREDPLAPTSGTSFLEIYHHQRAHEKPFDYMALGIQKTSNTQALCETAKQTGTHFLEAHQIAEPLLTTTLQAFTEPLDAVCLTICMDVVDAAFAPGVSAPATPGLIPAQIFTLIEKIILVTHVLSASLAEVNPHVDSSGRTEKLAARIITELSYRLFGEP